MLEFNAHEFIALMQHLGKLRDSARQFMTEHGHQGLLSQDVAEKLEEPYFKKIEEHCKLLNLDAGLSQLTRIREEIRKECTCYQFDVLLYELGNRIEDPFRARLFFYLPMDKVPYYKGACAFGPSGRKKRGYCRSRKSLCGRPLHCMHLSLDASYGARRSSLWKQARTS